MMMATGSVRKKHDADHAHRQGKLYDLLLERVDGAAYQVGPIIGDNDLHALRQTRFDDGFDLLLNAVDDVQDVLAVSRRDRSLRKYPPGPGWS